MDFHLYGHSGQTTPRHGQTDTQELPRLPTTVTAQSLRKLSVSGSSVATSGTFLCTYKVNK